ncbi:fibronectin type III domain-containing protein [Cellulomonas wangsupingiae]|uniref:fibronectin type III domain-containing protein n=1 Tax=Cellulomonas wangsupingiae TaxID=2968085 RepID=UPI0027DFF96C|nr:fibronectin type III domain-containing protein [Cellulomonas wangsupingiae]
MLTTVLALVLGLAWAPPATAATAPSAGPMPAAVADAPPPSLQPGAGQFVPLTPKTLLNGVGLASGGTTSITVAGANGVPAASEVSAVAVQVVIKGSGTAAGWTQLWPTGATRGSDSTVNFITSTYRASYDVVPTSADGAISVYCSQACTAYVRLRGYYTSAATSSAGTTYVPLAPKAVMNAAAFAAGDVKTLTLTGANSVPAADQVAAVALEVINASGGSGTVKVYEAGTTTGAEAGTVWVGGTGQTRSNFETVKTATTGRVSLSSTAAATVTVMLRGYFLKPTATTAGATYVPLARAAVVSGAALAAGGTTSPSLAGANGIPAASAVAAVALNAVASAPTGNGFLQVYPTGTTRPTDRFVSYTSGSSINGHDVVRLSDAGKATLYASAATELTTRLRGYYQKATAPQAPTGVSAVAGNASASVTWTAPRDGGATITGYTVRSTAGGDTISVPGNVTTASFSGLANGTATTFTVTATNAVGAGAVSAASAAVTPTTSPAGGPVILGALPRDGALTVSWAPPAPRDAGPITGYVVTTHPGGASVTVDADAVEATVAGLTNGIGYSVSVAATDAGGTGVVTTHPVPVAPEPASVPLAPVLQSALPYAGRVDLQWVAPVDGGSAITGYQVTITPGGRVVDVAADTTVTSVSGLTNGIAYTFAITATNAAGTSAAATSEPVAPVASRVPGEPVDLTASVTAPGAISLSWTAPTDPGTSAITGYQVERLPDRVLTDVTGTTLDVTGLSTATSYSFVVRARSAVGLGTGPTSTAIAPALLVKETPVVLTAASMATLTALRSDGSLVFSAAPSQVVGLTPGTIVISDAVPTAPQGFIGRIASVTTAEGTTTVTTTEVGLDELLTAGATASTDTVSASDDVVFEAAIPGARLAAATEGARAAATQGAFAAATDGPRHRAGDPGTGIGLQNGSVVIQIDTELGSMGNFATRLESTVQLTPEFDHEISWSQADGLKTHFGLATTVAAEARLKLGGGFDDLDREISVGTLRPGCTTVLVGPVPVVLCSEIAVTARLSADVSAGVTFAATYSRTVGVEIHTDGGEVTATPIDSGGQEGVEKPVLYGDATARVEVGPQLGVFLYGLAGPGVEISPYLEARADTSANPWLELRLGFKARAYLELKDLFGVGFKWDKVVFDTWVSIWNSGGPLAGITAIPGSKRTTVGTPVTFTVRRHLIPESTAVTWKVVSGPGTVDSSGVYTPTSAGTAVLEASTSDGRFTTRVTVLVGPSAPPGAPTDVQVYPALQGVNITWTPPSDTGGAPITSYTVTTVPATTTVTVPGTATSATMILPAGIYQARVLATNRQGLSSPYSLLSPAFVILDVPGGVEGPPNLLSRAADGSPDSAASSGRLGVRLSDDGRYVFHFLSTSSNLSPVREGSCCGGDYIVRFDRQTGERVPASVDALGNREVPAGANESAWADQPAFDTDADGRLLGYSPQRSRTVRIRDLRTGSVLTLDTRGLTSTEQVDQLELSSGGDSMVFSTYDSSARDRRVYRWTRTDGVVERLDLCQHPAGAACAGPVEWHSSADGSAIAYTEYVEAGKYHADVMVWTSAGGAIRNLTANTPNCPGDGCMFRQAPRLSGDGQVVTFTATRRQRTATSGLEYDDVGGVVIGRATGDLSTASPILSDTTVRTYDSSGRVVRRVSTRHYPAAVDATGQRLLVSVSGDEVSDVLVTDAAGATKGSLGGSGIGAEIGVAHAALSGDGLFAVWTLAGRAPQVQNCDQKVGTPNTNCGNVFGKTLS